MKATCLGPLSVRADRRRRTAAMSSSALPRSPMFEGRFGRLFRKLEPLELGDGELQAVAETMREGTAGGGAVGARVSQRQIRTPEHLVVASAQQLLVRRDLPSKSAYAASVCSRGLHSWAPTRWGLPPTQLPCPKLARTAPGAATT